MIQKKQSPNSPNTGLQLGDQESGCCVTTTTPCKYRFQFATTPATFSTITVDGDAIAFVHSFTTPLALHEAIISTLSMPVNKGGGGLVFEPNDLKVFYDPFSTTANRLTIEMISGVPIDNFITNVGTQATETAKCTKQTMCLHKIDYTLNAAISIVINNIELTLATYATAALLRTAILAQLTAEGLDSIAFAKVRAGESGHADLWLYVKEGVQVYHDGELVSRESCKAEFV